MSKPLSDKVKRFCDEYLILYNGTQAAIRAGYSKTPSVAKVTASRLLTNANVISYLAAKNKKRTEKLEITQERVMQELGRIAFSDIRAYFKPDGSLKNITELDDDAAAALASVETDELIIKKKLLGVSRKVKTYDKTKGLEMLAKHFGIFKDEGSPISLNVTISKGGKNANSKH